jgi:hypothetical protein
MAEVNILVVGTVVGAGGWGHLNIYIFSLEATFRALRSLGAKGSSIGLIGLIG